MKFTNKIRISNGCDMDCREESPIAKELDKKEEWEIGTKEEIWVAVLNFVDGISIDGWVAEIKFVMEVP